MEINLSNPTQLQTNSNVAAGVRDAAVKEKSDFQDSEIAVAKNEKVDVQVSDEERYARLKRNAKNFFNDVYAVSDSTFTIFKDSTGQFITRMTSLRDGSVKYVPEFDVLQYIESRTAAREALLEIEA